MKPLGSNAKSQLELMVEKMPNLALVMTVMPRFFSTCQLMYEFYTNRL